MKFFYLGPEGAKWSWQSAAKNFSIPWSVFSTPLLKMPNVVDEIAHDHMQEEGFRLEPPPHIKIISFN